MFGPKDFYEKFHTPHDTFSLSPYNMKNLLLTFDSIQIERPLIDEIIRSLRKFGTVDYEDSHRYHFCRMEKLFKNRETFQVLYKYLKCREKATKKIIQREHEIIAGRRNGVCITFFGRICRLLPHHTILPQELVNSIASFLPIDENIHANTKVLDCWVRSPTINYSNDYFYPQYTFTFFVVDPKSKVKAASAPFPTMNLLTMSTILETTFGFPDFVSDYIEALLNVN